jgi:hypothetical protein
MGVCSRRSTMRSISAQRCDSGFQKQMLEIAIATLEERPDPHYG